MHGLLFYYDERKYRCKVLFYGIYFINDIKKIYEIKYTENKDRFFINVHKRLQKYLIDNHHIYVNIYMRLNRKSKKDTRLYIYIYIIINSSNL